MSSNYTSLFDVWSETSSRVFESVLEANRAAFTAFGMPDDGRRSDADLDRKEERLEADEELAEWTVERSVEGDGELAVGDHVRFTKTLTEGDVERFAAASGDTNPIHLDDEWAERTQFGGRIVHGTLVSGLISAALARLPGGVIYLSQDVEFQAPVRIGDRVTADVEVVEDLGGDRYRLRTTVERGEEVVIDGEAVVLISETPDVDPGSGS